MTDTGTGPKPTRTKRPILLRILIWLVLVVGVLGLLLGAVIYTEQPAFCKVCHEMTPYYDAWAAGAHNDVSCIECHVEPGLVNRAAHKFVALKEVWVHFTGDPKFPMSTAEVPDDRCTVCHTEVPAETTEPFDHALHLDQPMACTQCHADAGHRVTYQALSEAGILASGAQPEGSSYVGEIILGSETGTVLAGHAEVKCSNCHDMAAAECQTCHAAPTDHFPGECADCHEPTVPFEEAVFEHPAVGEEHTYRSFPCGDCHPDGYRTASCVKCHEGGTPEEDDDD